MSAPTPPTRPPTADELRKDAVVLAALELAWTDSQADDSTQRHEEGGWIYMNLTTSEITVQRAPRGQQHAIDLDNPPLFSGATIVGVFHTHPNPSAEGWYTGPSEADEENDARDGIPDLIRADDGIHLSGPNSRRGGLAGGPGYPPQDAAPGT